jgi:surfactin synthase thioesterase subunit
MLARVDSRFALFGHSMGALLAFELAHALTQHDRPPAHLFVSGYAAPQLPARADKPLVHLLTDEDLRAHLVGLEGTPASVLEAPELLRVMLPTVRADFAVCETYQYTAREPLPVPITALGGVEDPDAGPDELDAWREHTAREFTLDCFPGGHFYLLAKPETVIDTVAARLLNSIGGSES